MRGRKSRHKTLVALRIEERSLALHGVAQVTPKTLPGAFIAARNSGKDRQQELLDRECIDERPKRCLVGSQPANIVEHLQVGLRKAPPGLERGPISLPGPISGAEACLGRLG